MDTPGKKKRDPQKNAKNQRRYRARQYATVDGIEEVRTRNHRRYYERIARLKATGQCEDFKQHKCEEGKRRYHTMSEEQRKELRRKNLMLQKTWIANMKRESTYETYKQRLNARRREQLAEKKRAMVVDGWKQYQKVLYARRAESQLRKRWSWLDDHLARPFPLPWLPLDWAESEPEEDTVQTLRANAWEKMDQYL